jgi:osmotically inducible lipoprotein OsmB
MATRRIVMLVGSVLAVAPVGCSTMNQTEKGALGGGAIGAGVGTLIGAATGNPKTGAVVGGLVGAGVGGAIGNEADRSDEEKARVRHASEVQAYRDDQPTRISEVIKLVQQGQGETVIINHIRANRMTFVLTADDLNTLKANNVPDRVIAYMQESGRVVYAPRPRVVREEVIVTRPVYVAPAPVIYAPPPSGVFISGRFR